uniref:dual-specificity kinase n=1 Tax=Strigamia maritima TaxID=126957 RepID=T1JGY8_STRMM
MSETRFNKLSERPARTRVSYHGDEGQTTRPNTTMGPSCQALRNAVAALNRLDDFTCEKIGSGFFSEVFKVTHRTSGQVMVLKMNMSHSNRPNMLREVQLMNRLSHPNILKFMGVCVHEGQLHALTEYINDGSLEQLLLNKDTALSWKVRIQLARDIAKGIGYLHSKGVFHRDLTSKNVLIKSEGPRLTAVVGDFGLAEKIPDPLSKIRLPTVGSPYWMAPECLKGKWYNEKADVFSYGIILCEIIARVEADPDYLPRTENFGLDYIAFSEMCPDCPPEFLQLAFTCCMIDPKQRPSFSELVDALDLILTDIVLKSRTERDIVATTNYKMLHRRSKSEDDLLVASNGFTTPSDKARCHYNHNRRKASDKLMTPKHVGEVMSMGDPYYRPCSRNLNPFAALPQLNGGRKILASSRDLFSSCFELPSPASMSTPPRYRNAHCQLSRSNSLPDSPTLLRQRSGASASRCRTTAHPRSVSAVDDASSYVRTSCDDCLVFASTSDPKLTRRRGSCESGFFSVGDGEHLSPEGNLDEAMTALSPRSSTIGSDADFEEPVHIHVQVVPTKVNLAHALSNH